MVTNHITRTSNLVLNCVDTDMVLVVYKHANDLMPRITRTINLFRNYTLKCKLNTVIVALKTERYKSSSCKHEMCTDCYDAISNSYCNTCFYSNYSL